MIPKSHIELGMSITHDRCGMSAKWIARAVVNGARIEFHDRYLSHEAAREQAHAYIVALWWPRQEFQAPGSKEVSTCDDSE